MKALFLAVLLGLSLFGLQRCKTVDLDEADPGAGPGPADPDTLTFGCTGKTQCSEMRSCAEAKFYLANCEGAAMDGDGDGLPCEDQWCGH